MNFGQSIIGPAPHQGTLADILSNQQYVMSSSFDAFARFRTANPETIFDSNFIYDLHPYLFETILAGGASAPTHIPNEACMSMQVDATNGQSQIVQTREYHRYQPGKSQLIIQTLVVGAGIAGNRRRWGYFDASGGVFWQLEGTTLSVVKRYLGADDVVAQSNWNVDKMDGTGPSGITLDLSMTQFFWINFGWLGVAPVSFGVMLPNGRLHLVHRFENTNMLNHVWTQVPSLPLRYENVNIAESSGTPTLKPICSTVVSEGGQQEENFYAASASTGIGAGKSVGGSWVPIISIRPSNTFNGIVNRTRIFPEAFEILVASANIEWQIIHLNDEFDLTDSNFLSRGGPSAVDYDTAATAIIAPGGGELPHVIMRSGYIAASASTRGDFDGQIVGRYPITLNVAGDADSGSVITLACRSTTGTASVWGAINWSEFR